jgi:hypothetical protein
MYRWDLHRQINVLGNAVIALLKRALQVRLANRVAPVGLLVDERDKAVLDRQVHLEALFDLLLDVAAGHDVELGAAGDRISIILPNDFARGR